MYSLKKISLSLMTAVYFWQVSPVVAQDGGIGIGPIDKIESGALDAALAARGAEIFSSKCAACHKFGERYVGPDLASVTKRRKPEWIMNMILNPSEMTQKDPTAQELLGEFLTQMTNQNLSKDDARALLEHLRDKDK